MIGILAFGNGFTSKLVSTRSSTGIRRFGGSSMALIERVNEGQFGRSSRYAVYPAMRGIFEQDSPRSNRSPIIATKSDACRAASLLSIRHTRSISIDRKVRVRLQNARDVIFSMVRDRGGGDRKHISIQSCSTGTKLTAIPQSKAVTTAPETGQPRTRFDRLDQPLDQDPDFLLGRQFLRCR